MHKMTASRVLLGMGVAVGVVGSAGLFAGLDPVPLAGWLVNVAMYKLVFIAAGGLMTAGAVIGRWEKRTSLPPHVPPQRLKSEEPDVPAPRWHFPE